MAEQTEALRGRERDRVLLVLLSALFFSLITVSIINVALPAIETGLNASAADLQWALTGYSLTFGVVLVAAGRAGDLLGRGRLFLAGVTLFGIASTVASLAPNALVLNLARAVMGVGAGLYNPQVSGLIQQHYRGAERARAFGLFGAVVGTAVAIGPVIGGLLLGSLPSWLGWRMTLGINIPLALLAVILGWRWLPREGRTVRRQHTTDHGSAAPAADNGSDPQGSMPHPHHDLDPFGAVLLGVAVLFVMLPFMVAAENPLAWWALPTGLVVLGIWLLWEHNYARRGHEPMVNLAMFRIRTFSLGAAMITAFFAGTTTIWVLIALFVQNGLGRSALVAGLIGMPSALLSIYSAPLGGRLVVRWGRKIVVFGLLCNLTGLALTAWVSTFVANGAGVWLLALSTLPLGFGAGWINSPNQVLSLRDVPVANGGTAAGIMQTGQRIATAVGTAAVTGLFFQQVAHGYAHALRMGYALIASFVIVALVIALADLAADSRARTADTSPVLSDNERATVRRVVDEDTH
ncbi:MAG: MFS transporter [Actinomycetaceae bacterium]|nr:MFS transporter [Actinomycetaceae bacterium]